MNRQEVFEAWKRHKQRIEVPRDFSAEVLDRLREAGPPVKCPAELSPSWPNGPRDPGPKPP